MTVRETSFLAPSYIPPTINDVPNELIPLIFSFLTPLETQYVSLTCHKWLDASKNAELKEGFFKPALQGKLPLTEICFLAWSLILHKESKNYDRRISLLCAKALTVKDRSDKPLSNKVKTILKLGTFLGRVAIPCLNTFEALKLDTALEKASKESPYAKFVLGLWYVCQAYKETESCNPENVREYIGPLLDTCLSSQMGIKGQRLLEEASSLGIADATFFLSQTNTHSEKETLEIIKNAARQGSVIACNVLSRLADNKPIDEELRSFRYKAAEAGHELWQVKIGLELVSQYKTEEAVAWLGLAALQNNMKAKLYLEVLSTEGVPGVQDYLDQLKAEGLLFELVDDF